MNWTLALPEIVLGSLAMAILVYGVVQKRDPFLPCAMMVMIALAVGAVMVIETPAGTGYGGQFSTDPFATFVKLLVLAGAGLSLILAVDYNPEQGIARFEFPVLILLSVVGMMIMASATSMMSLYLGLELQSLATYVLAAFARDELRSSESGLKYFVLGALASGLLLYGISLTYGFSGTFDFHRLGEALADPANVSPGLVVGIVFIIAGLAFKMSAVPFHMWTPDVYEGAPTSVTAFLSTAPKVAAIALLLRVLGAPFAHLAPQWHQIVEFVSIASMVWGSLAAIGQRSIKRLMAYSSIAHIGYALIGLATGTPDGLRGVLFYMATYVFMSIAAFGVIVAMRRRGQALERIDDLAGLARTDGVLAASMAVVMFSMAGIPPTSGFLGKLLVILPAVQQGFWSLAVIAVVTSVVGAYYYIRVVKVMYFDEGAVAGGAGFDARPAGLSFVTAVGTVTTLFFAFVTNSVLLAAQAAAHAVFG